MPIILPVDEPGDSRTGTLTNISAATISNVLGFTPNVKDDPSKVKCSWGATVDGVRIGIWDYNGSYRYRQFSTFGPHEVLKKLFPDNYEGDR